MRVVEQSNNRLCVVEQPWMLGSLLGLFALLSASTLITGWTQMPWTERLMFVGLLFFMSIALRYLVQWVRIEFNRTTGRIRIERRGLLRRIEESYPLDLLRRVRTVTSSDNCTSRIVLSFDERMLDRLGPSERSRIELGTKRGLRTVAANEVALTHYFSSSDANQQVAGVIRSWAGLPS